jgi:acyl carrier protein
LFFWGVYLCKNPIIYKEIGPYDSLIIFLVLLLFLYEQQLSLGDTPSMDAKLINLDSRLIANFDVDSLDSVELAMCIEEDFQDISVRIPPGTIIYKTQRTNESIREIYDFIQWFAEQKNT